MRAVDGPRDIEAIDGRVVEIAYLESDTGNRLQSGRRIVNDEAGAGDADELAGQVIETDAVRAGSEQIARGGIEHDIRTRGTDGQPSRCAGDVCQTENIGAIREEIA